MLIATRGGHIIYSKVAVVVLRYISFLPLICQYYDGISEEEQVQWQQKLHDLTRSEWYFCISNNFFISYLIVFFF